MIFHLIVWEESEYRGERCFVVFRQVSWKFRREGTFHLMIWEESESRERCFVAYSNKVPSLSDTMRLG